MKKLAAITAIILILSLFSGCSLNDIFSADRSAVELDGSDTSAPLTNKATSTTAQNEQNNTTTDNLNTTADTSSTTSSTSKPITTAATTTVGTSATSKVHQTTGISTSTKRPTTTTSTKRVTTTKNTTTKLINTTTNITTTKATTKTSTTTIVTTTTTTTTKRTTTTTSASHNTPDINGVFHNATASEVLNLVNAARTQAGLNRLTMDTDRMMSGAKIRAKEITKHWAHERPNGSSWTTIFSELNMPYLQKGENLAQGYSTAQAVFDGWMSSQGHRANILNTNFTHISIVCFEYNGTYYWVQLFGG